MPHPLHSRVGHALGGMLGLPKPANGEFAVTGTFTGDGQPANLAFVSAHKGTPFSGKETVVLVFTEKDHSQEEKPKIMAGFGHFGSALIITVNADGLIVGCEVAHAAHQKSPFNAIGRIKTADYSNDGGTVQGKITSGGEDEAFGQKWNVEITFRAKVQ